MELLLQLLEQLPTSNEALQTVGGKEGLLSLLNETLNAIAERDATIKAVAKEAFGN